MFPLKHLGFLTPCLNNGFVWTGRLNVYDATTPVPVPALPRVLPAVTRPACLVSRSQHSVVHVRSCVLPTRYRACLRRNTPLPPCHPTTFTCPPRHAADMRRATRGNLPLVLQPSPPGFLRARCDTRTRALLPSYSFACGAHKAFPSARFTTYLSSLSPAALRALAPAACLLIPAAFSIAILPFNFMPILPLGPPHPTAYLSHYIAHTRPFLVTTRMGSWEFHLSLPGLVLTLHAATPYPTLLALLPSPRHLPHTLCTPQLHTPHPFPHIRHHVCSVWTAHYSYRGSYFHWDAFCWHLFSPPRTRLFRLVARRAGYRARWMPHSELYPPVFPRTNNATIAIAVPFIVPSRHHTLPPSPSAAPHTLMPAPFTTRYPALHRASRCACALHAAAWRAVVSNTAYAADRHAQAVAGALHEVCTRARTRTYLPPFAHHTL